jgi:hypothetical protein
MVENLKHVTGLALSGGARSGFTLSNPGPTHWVSPKSDMLNFLDDLSIAQNEKVLDWPAFAKAVKETARLTAGEIERVHPRALAFLKNLRDDGMWMYAELEARGANVSARTPGALVPPKQTATRATTGAAATSTTPVDPMQKQEALPRQPGFAFGRQASSMSVSRLTELLQQRAWMTVECKKRLVMSGDYFSGNGDYQQALRETSRDFGCTLGYAMTLPQDGSNLRLPYFFSVVCDDERYQLIRMSLTRSGVRKVATRVYTVTTKKQAQEFFVLCSLALQCASLSWSYDYPVSASAAELNVEAVLAIGSETAVLRVGENAVLKVPRRGDHECARLQTEISNRREYEQLFVGDAARYLLHAESASFFSTSDALEFAYDDERSAEKWVEFYLCDANRDALLLELARKVWYDVSAALDVLHKANVTFADLHPGNVVIGGDGIAKLIDCECVCKVGTLVNGDEATRKRVMFRRGFIPPAYHKVGAKTTTAGDKVSLLLVVAWILDYESLRTNITSAQTGGSVHGNQKWQVTCQKVADKQSEIMQLLAPPHRGSRRGGRA